MAHIDVHMLCLAVAQQPWDLGKVENEGDVERLYRDHLQSHGASHGPFVAFVPTKFIDLFEIGRCEGVSAYSDPEQKIPEWVSQRRPQLLPWERCLEYAAANYPDSEGDFRSALSYQSHEGYKIFMKEYAKKYDLLAF